MKKKIPLMITFAAGLLVVLSEFIPHKPFGTLTAGLESWFMVISAFAIILGQMNLIKIHWLKIKYKDPNWPYFIVTLSSFFIMVIAGLIWGTNKQHGLLGGAESIVSSMGAKPFDYFFDHFYQPLAATMFSLLAFFIASAAYRAFIARTIEAKLLLIAALIVMLGNTGLGSIMTSWLPLALKPYLHLPLLSEFIMKYLNTAGQRAIIISAGLGVVGSSLRIILGIERSYLGG